MTRVGPDTDGALWIGCVRGRFTWNPLRWPGLAFGFLVRAFRLLRQPWLGRYSHLFLWHGTTIWEASTTWRRGHIREYNRRDVVVDAMEVRLPDGLSPPGRPEASEPLPAWRVRRALEMANAMVGRPYDWYQIIRIAAFELGILHDDRLLPRDGERPICSEGVAMCYLAAGVDLPGPAGVPLWRFAPDHMDKLRRLRPDLVRLVGRLTFGEKGEAS